MDWQVNVPISKVEPNQRLVFGWASIIETADGLPVIDLQDDVIEETELEKAAYKFVLSSREGGDSHEVTKGVATLVESFVVTKEKRDMLKISLPLGWWVGFRIHDDGVFKRVVDGDLSMFSIGGSTKRMPKNA